MRRTFGFLALSTALILLAGCGRMGPSETEKVQAAQLAEANRKNAEMEGRLRRMDGDVQRAVAEREKFQHDAETGKAVLAERDALIASLQAQLKEQQARLDGFKDELTKVETELSSLRQLLEGQKKAPANP